MERVRKVMPAIIDNTEDFIEWIEDFYGGIFDMRSKVHNEAETAVMGDQGVFTAWKNAVDMFLLDLIICDEIILSESADKEDILRWINDTCS
jgi:hypothetical protein